MSDSDSGGVIANWKLRVKRIKSKTYALYLACRDPRTPWYAKLFVALIVAYALSPVDLIPDFIPVLGYLDDLILLPLGIALAVRMIPKTVMEECSAKAESVLSAGTRKNWIAGGIIIAVWISVIALATIAIVKRISIRSNDY